MLRQTSMPGDAATLPRETESARTANVYRSEILPHRARWSLENPGNRAIEDERWAIIADALRENGHLPLKGKRILEVGCGSGRVLGRLFTMGAKPEHTVGVDLLPERLAEARRLYPAMQLHCGSAEHLDFPDGSFDIVVASTLFSSLWSLDRAVAAEMRRVLKPTGCVIWYDLRFNNPANRHVHGVGRRDIAALFPDFVLVLRTTTLIPLVARRLGPLTPTLYRFLARFPFLRSHHAGLLVPPRERAI